MAKILLVDDEPILEQVLSMLLRTYGYETVSASDGTQALEVLKTTTVDMVLSDIRMSPMDGMALLRILRREYPQLPVVMLTAYASVSTASQALTLGAFDYTTKPIKIDELLRTVKRALESVATDVASDSVSGQQYEKSYRFGNIVAASPSMQALCDQIERIGVSSANVLICGEKGTGKRSIAATIHANGPRKEKPIVEVNAAEIPEPVLEAQFFEVIGSGTGGASLEGQNLFQAAEAGVMILDEIEMMSPETQARLLKVLKEKKLPAPEAPDGFVPVDVQVIALSSAPDIASLSNEGGILPDMIAFLGIFTLEVGPLRKRQEDIMPLVFHLLGKHLPNAAEKPTVDAAVRDLLTHYDWPGNVNELEAIVKYAAERMKNGRMTLQDLPENLAAAGAKMPKSEAGADFTKSEHWAKSLKAYLHDYLAKK